MSYLQCLLLSKQWQRKNAYSFKLCAYDIVVVAAGIFRILLTSKMSLVVLLLLGLDGVCYRVQLMAKIRNGTIVRFHG